MSIVTATTHRSPQRTHLPASTNDYHLFHQTRHHSTKPPLHTKKHSMKADTTTFYTTNRQWVLNGNTDNVTTSSDTTLHSAKMSTLISVLPPPQAFLIVLSFYFCAGDWRRSRYRSQVDKHFSKDHKLRKIFNRDTIKISYSCMNNTKQIIDNHNKQILNSSKHADISTEKHVPT